MLKSFCSHKRQTIIVYKTNPRSYLGKLDKLLHAAEEVCCTMHAAGQNWMNGFIEDLWRSIPIEVLLSKGT